MSAKATTTHAAAKARREGKPKRRAPKGFQVPTAPERLSERKSFSERARVGSCEGAWEPRCLEMTASRMSADSIPSQSFSGAETEGRHSASRTPSLIRSNSARQFAQD